MATTLHGSACKTPRLRADLQGSQASIRALAARYGLNVKTVAEWRARTSTADAPMGLRQRRSKRMNRTLKEATVKAFHYEALASLTAHLQTFVMAYNFAKHLKALRWRTPFQSLCEVWTKDPSAFKINPHHLIPGPHT